MHFANMLIIATRSREADFDRSPLLHCRNLLAMQQKYPHPGDS